MNREIDHPLHSAARNGDVQEVERLLSAGEDPNKAIHFKGFIGTPLDVAVRYCPADFGAQADKHISVVRLLLEKGADLHSEVSTGGTPLHVAASAGNIYLAEILLRYGTDVNSKNESQHKTSLHCAVCNRRLRTVDFLITNGADLNIVADRNPDPDHAVFLDCAGLTPLHIAAREGCLGIVRVFLAVGASKE